MTRLIAVALVLLSVSVMNGCASSRPAPTTAETVNSCPLPGSGEAAEDCPWAMVARDIAKETAANQPAMAVLQRDLPDLYRQMQSDSKNTRWLGLWGRSINFDELAKGVIVQPELIRGLLSFFGQPLPTRPEEERLAHAGVEHTYGYLFSNLKTQFGYKRARWVKPTLDQGFGLPASTISPKPTSGTLFSNVTYLAGRIAFRKDPKTLKVLEAEKRAAAPALQNYPFSKLKITRLEETVSLPEGARKVTLRTDFVEFPEKVTGDTNTHLLVYSIDDSAVGHPQIISAFPVQASFVQMATKAENLGKDKDVITRYNAYVSGFTGQKLKGERKLK